MQLNSSYQLSCQQVHAKADGIERQSFNKQAVSAKQAWRKKRLVCFVEETTANKTDLPSHSLAGMP